MDTANLFSVVSQCFAAVDKTTWNDIVEEENWNEFLCDALDAVEGELGERTDARATRQDLMRALGNVLACEEAEALCTPPSFEEKQQFAARHFTGGLPQSVLPVESLYASWTLETSNGVPLSKAKGAYAGDSARYMRDLISRMKLNLPEAFRACPDHLSLELDILAFLEEYGLHTQAQEFMMERFAWLTAYRIKLLGIENEAYFYLGLIDVLLGFVSVHNTDDESDRSMKTVTLDASYL